MAKHCQCCGRKLGFFAGGTICKECQAAQEAEIALKQAESQAEVKRIQDEIVATKDITDEQIARLQNRNTQALVSLYLGVYESFEANKELDETEISALKKIQEAFGLTNEDVGFDDRVRPYIYVNCIRTEGALPTVNLQIEGSSPVVLKKGEVVHFADAAVIKEIKSVSLGYKGGSHGVSIPIGGGMRYRVGAHRGHIQREDRLIETSRGALIITNQRLFLQPYPGHKPLSIPLTKVLSYQCFENGIEVYKEGREKGYFFAMAKSSSAEISALCLGHLLKQ